MSTRLRIANYYPCGNFLLLYIVLKLCRTVSNDWYVLCVSSLNLECDSITASSLVDINGEGNVFSKRSSSELCFNNSIQPLTHLNHEQGYQIQTISSHYRNPMDETCAPLYSLVTIQSSSSTKMFIRLDKNNTNTYPVESGHPIVMAFDIDPMEDVGALFSVGMDASQLPVGGIL